MRGHKWGEALWSRAGEGLKRPLSGEGDLVAGDGRSGNLGREEELSLLVPRRWSLENDRGD